ncbi:MAG TPA: AI-2E family transporter [Corynebacterium sp.]|nr:AI-2E family transporter [Corynebacterium sp.]
MTEKPDQEIVAEDQDNVGHSVAEEVSAVDNKAAVMGSDARALSSLSWRFIVIVAALALAGFVLKFVWVGLLPVILAILLSSVLSPVTAKLRSWKFPSALAAISTLLGLLLSIGGTFTAMGPVVSRQGAQLWDQAEEGVDQLMGMVNDMPFNIDAQQIDELIDDATSFLQGQMSSIASGVISGASAASSVLVTVAVMFIISFFILKDGDKFLPWVRKYSGPSIGWHATELLTRVWKTLAGFIQAQAAVSFVDALFIGLGLWALGVPLAFVLAIVTFFAGFIPIIGAVTAGALAVVIALVSNGLINALLVLALILIVQQVEGNVLQPILQSKAMGLHAAIVLLSVTIGSALAGIIGAFLAVPVAATIATVLRYHAEMISLRAKEISAEDIEIRTGSVGDDPEDSPRAQVRKLYEALSA